jgi:S-methylmethionine-dependent homocysteine/selenocysteine methylase
MSKLRQRWSLGKQGEAQQHREGPIIWLLDGGVSTYLESILRRPFQHRSLWSSSLLLTSEGREAIRQCHLDFFRAGSDLASTVTYQCNYLPQHSNFDMDSMLRKGVQLARKAAEIVAAEDGRPRFVVASIGCYGSALADGSEYTGKTAFLAIKSFLVSSCVAHLNEALFYHLSLYGVNGNGTTKYRKLW